MTQVPKVVHLTRKPRIHSRYDRGCVYVRDGIICDLDIPILRVICGCNGFYHYSMRDTHTPNTVSGIMAISSSIPLLFSISVVP